VRLVSPDPQGEDIDAFFADVEREFNAAAADAFEGEGEAITGELQVEPAVPHTFQWTSMKQKVAAQKTANWGGGRPYVRRHVTSQAWEAFPETTADGHLFTVRNYARGYMGQPNASFVYGSDEAGDSEGHQQVGHILTGWRTAYPVVQAAFERIEKKARESFDERMARVIRSRA